MNINNPAPGNNPGLPPINLPPVSDSENAETKGAALACEAIYQDNLQKVSRLRKRQAEYLASLPTEPTEKLTSIMELMKGEHDRFPDEAHQALNLSVMLEVFVKHGDMELHSPEHKAAIYVAEMITDNLHALQGKLRGVWDVATK